MTSLTSICGLSASMQMSFAMNNKGGTKRFSMSWPKKNNILGKIKEFIYIFKKITLEKLHFQEFWLWGEVNFDAPEFATLMIE